MTEFEDLFQQAVAMKQEDMQSRRRDFENQPVFIKSGLYYSDKYADDRQKTFEERYELAKNIKDVGTNFFKEGSLTLYSYLGKYTDAAHEYEKSLSIFQYILNVNPDWKNEGIIDADLTFIQVQGDTDEQKFIIKDLQNKLYVNLAITYFNCNQFNDSVQACDYAIKNEPSAKAYYRRAKARLQNINANEKDFNLAIQDFKLSYVMAPNFEVEQQIIIHENNLKKMKRKDKNLYQNMMKTQPEDDLNQVRDLSDAIEQTTQGQSVEDMNNSEDDILDYPCLQDIVGDEDNEELDKGFNSLNYAMSYEEDPTIPVPKEVEELSKLIEGHGISMLRMFEMTGQKKEAENLKVQLEQAMKAKRQLEKISRLDFERPKQVLQELLEAALKFGVDLNDDTVKDEFRKIQQNNLKNVNVWLRQQGDPLQPPQMKARLRTIKPDKKIEELNKTLIDDIIRNVDLYQPADKIEQDTLWQKVFSIIACGVSILIIVLFLCFKLMGVGKREDI